MLCNFSRGRSQWLGEVGHLRLVRRHTNKPMLHEVGVLVQSFLFTVVKVLLKAVAVRQSLFQQSFEVQRF